jgi:hypothetical protein
MNNLLTAVIIPIATERAEVGPILAQLALEPVQLEVILVTAPGVSLPLPDTLLPLHLATAAGSTRGGLLNTGAAIAQGEILLFVWPGSQLPFEALLTIEKNLSLLPQTVGGNFHLNLQPHTWGSRLTTGFIARQRYLGRYYSSSGIFVRAAVFKSLGGFAPLNLRADYDFGLRLEASGPTLFLPDKIIVPAEKLGPQAIVVWSTIILLQKLGVPPPILETVANKLGWN